MSALRDAAQRWRVPYTVAGAGHGHLIVTASSREDAINAAISVHGRSPQLYDQHGQPGSRVRLTPRQRAAIQYDEPQMLAARPTQAGAA